MYQQLIILENILSENIVRCRHWIVYSLMKLKIIYIMKLLH